MKGRCFLRLEGNQDGIARALPKLSFYHSVLFGFYCTPEESLKAYLPGKYNTKGSFWSTHCPCQRAAKEGKDIWKFVFRDWARGLETLRRCCSVVLSCLSSFPLLVPLASSWKEVFRLLWVTLTRNILLWAYPCGCHDPGPLSFCLSHLSGKTPTTLWKYYVFSYEEHFIGHVQIFPLQQPRNKCKQHSCRAHMMNLCYLRGSWKRLKQLPVHGKEMATKWEK